MPVLYIVRGLPGSGKSTLAKKLVKVDFHREADMYHMEDGAYVFKPDRVKESHEWCKSEVAKLMATGEDVAVSNTFTRRWEYESYIGMAVDAGYDVQIIECHGTWSNDHNVPDVVLEQMRQRWEPTI